MEKIKNLLFRNIGLKILSLMIAIVLWIVSMNINNPEMTQTYSVPLSLLNLNHVSESGMVVLNEEELSKQDIYIKVKSTRNDLASFDSSRISVSIDFSPLDITNVNNIGKSIPVSVYVSIPSMNYEIVDYSPRTVDVTFDELSTKDIPINIVTSGKPENGYEVLGSNIVSPEYVTLKGAKSYVDDVQSAEVYVDLSGVSESINEQYPISILDVNGNDVTDEFSLMTQSANVIATVVRTDSIPISEPKIIGEPQDGYKVVDTTWTPKQVDVIGYEDEIAQIGSIELPSINITGAKDSVTKVIDLNDILNPMGVSVQDGSQSECSVTVSIEPVVTKMVDVPTSNITFNNISNDDYSNLSIPDSIKVTITGPENEMANFDPNTITGVTDMSLYNVGDEDIEVDMSCTVKDIEVQTPVRLTVTDNNADDKDLDVETQTQTEDSSDEINGEVKSSVQMPNEASEEAFTEESEEAENEVSN